MLRFVNVSIGSGSAARCVRCHGDRERSAYRAAADVAAAIESAAAGWDAGPGPNVEIAGPEPFGHPELPAIVSAAGRAGVRRLRLVTDAAALTNPANAAGSIAAGVRHIAFTLLGGSPGMHDILADEAGGLDATLSGVRAYVAAAAEQEASVCVTALVPVCRHNVRDVVSAVGVAVQAGANEVRLSIDDGGLDVGAAIPWLTAACDTGVVNAVWVELEGLPFCLVPGYDLHLADTFRDRPGQKGPACGSCPLAPVCAAAPAGAAAETLAMLAPPDGAAALASAVATSRWVEL